MNVGRIFANAIVRRAAYAVVALCAAALLSLLGLGNAHAQSGDSIEQAYAKCKAGEAAMDPGFAVGTPCHQMPGSTATSGVWRFLYGRTAEGYNPNQFGSTYQYSKGCVAPEQWSDTRKKCQIGCETREDYTTTFRPPSGSMRCNDGCNETYFSNGDGTSNVTVGNECSWEPQDCDQLGNYYWHSTLHSCVPMEPECPTGEAQPDGTCKDNNCPAGMKEDAFGLCKPDGSECPAGQARGPDGACTSDKDGDGKEDCPAGQAKGADGTCKPDSDDDGEPDEPGDKSEFSGGDDCNTPPTCSGDAIMCGQARIQWRIECNLRRDFSISGGACEAIPVCTGRGCNAMEYAQLLQQWRTACKTADAGGGPGAPGNGDANGNGIPDVLEQNIGEIEGEQGEVGSVGADAWNDVNTSGWLGGGSCPGLAGELDPQMSAIACQQGGYIQWLMRLLAVVVAGAIIGRAASGSV